MDNYYVETRTNIEGDFLVHKSGCEKLPKKSYLFYLGLHVTCDSAVLKAKSKGYIFSNGCKHCIEECYSHSNKEKGMVY